MNRPPVRRYRNIFLVGLPGVGKTSFGMAYAAHTSRSFYDLDRMIEVEQGRSVAEIFADTASGGEQAFRELEHHMLQKLAKRQNVVVALGGGTPCSEDAQRILQEHGLVVQLRDELKTLVPRLRAARGTRPLFASAATDDDVLAALQALHEARHEWYDRAHVVLDLRFSSLDSAKLELASYERRAFRRTYVHDLEALGLSLPAAPEMQVQPRARYVLRERPYLALVADFGRSGARAGNKSKRQGAPAQRSRKSRSLKANSRKRSGSEMDNQGQQGPGGRETVPGTERQARSPERSGRQGERQGRPNDRLNNRPSDRPSDRPNERAGRNAERQGRAQERSARAGDRTPRPLDPAERSSSRPIQESAPAPRSTAASSGPSRSDE